MVDNNPGKILITGGAGFIGANTAHHYLQQGKSVTILDNFSRPNVHKNVKWLRKLDKRLKVVFADVSFDREILGEEVEKADAVIHLAAQVAVTSSIDDPREDFDINALGTLNVLEAIRKSKNKPPIIYASTNKVYGAMEKVSIRVNKTRYVYGGFPNGISEDFQLDFHSPYGCSKGAADQYVGDYARIYGLKTAVFRQSCIYGQRQFGIEDQGWVAWFIIAAVLGRPITIYGDGKQVRDLLYIDDLVSLFDLTFKKIDKVSGQAFNIGGGPKFTVSIWQEFEPLISKYLGKKIRVKYSDWRPGDQKVYISDIRKTKKLLGWTPKVGVKEGLEKLVSWVQENKELF